MLRRKPHSFTVRIMTELQDGEHVALAPSLVSSVAARGQITPLSQQAAFSRVGIELMRPHLLLTDVSQIAQTALVVGNEVVFGDREFLIRGPVAVWDAGGSAEHFACVLEETYT